jgi:hypothetical protein
MMAGAPTASFVHEETLEVKATDPKGNRKTLNPCYPLIPTLDQFSWASEQEREISYLTKLSF